MSITVARHCRTCTGFAGSLPSQLWARGSLSGNVLGRVLHRVGEVGREETLKGHHVRAQTRGTEVLALAGPIISVERDAMGAVVGAKSELEFLEGDPLGLFGVSLGLLDLGDEARVHPPTSTAPSFRLAPDESDSRPGRYRSISRGNVPRLARYHSRVRERRVVGDRREANDRNAEERGHDGRIELRAGAAPDLLARRVDQQPTPVRAVARHRVERVTDGEDARAEGDAIAL